MDSHPPTIASLSWLRVDGYNDSSDAGILLIYST